MTDKKLFFTIGPVQGFVAQARRTRDLWGGSFLLSFLTGHAMKSIRENGGEIVVPDVTKNELLRWIEGKREDQAPRIGSLPNRFQVSLKGDDPKELAKLADKAKQALVSKWKDVADAVWKEYVSPVTELGSNTKIIWDRQIKNFWDISWVVGEDISAIAARKNWRGHYPPEEGGDHCTMMGDWQEISGFVRSREKANQKRFWNRLRQGTGDLDLRPDERLCTIALVKRLFPKVSKDAIEWDVKSTNWPSTVYMAALPWVQKVVENKPEIAREYAQQVKEAQPKAIRHGISRGFGFDKENLFLELDGNFYLDHTLESAKLTPLKGTPDDGSKEDNETKQKRKNLRGSLKEIRKMIGSSPSPYYALLLMDGDSMGKLLGEQEDGGEAVSRALGAFTDGVAKIVKEHNGVTVYAGGDDVLALLPVSGALECAQELSDMFVNSFNKKATISAGLIFTHYHVPLMSVMEEAREMLDDIAKDKNGRDSIAVSVLKPSGKYAQWVTTWKHFNSTGGENLKELVSMFGKSGDDRQLSASFIYRTRDTFCVLAKDSFWKPGTYFDLLENLDPVKLLAADYKRSMGEKVSIGRVEEVANELLEISYEHCNKGNDAKKRICADGMILVKFLAENSMEGSK